MPREPQNSAIDAVKVCFLYFRNEGHTPEIAAMLTQAACSLTAVEGNGIILSALSSQICEKLDSIAHVITGGILK